MLALIRSVLRFGLPILVLGLFLFAGKQLLDTAPDQQRRPKTANPPMVEVLNLAPQSYQVRLKSHGLVQATKQSTISAEVKGRVIKLSPKLHVGGLFKKDEVLVEIDDSDLQQKLIIVKAELAQAQAQLTLEQGDAERDQVLRDRALLGLSGEPSKLALREPQRKSNEAALAAAKARVAQARTQLTRTKINAPFDSRIITKQVSINQFVNAGTTLLELVATDKIEVRLPLTAKQLSFLNLEALSNEAGPNVAIEGSEKKPTSVRRGTLVRSEGIVNAQSLQQYVVAEVAQPFVKSADGGQALTLGQFVSAQIDATVLNDVWVIPRNSTKNNTHIQLVSKDNKLIHKQITLLWADAENVVIRDGIEVGQRLIKTPIALAAEGINVSIAGESPKGEANESGNNLSQKFKALTKELALEKCQAFKALPEHKKMEVLNLPADKQRAFFETL